MCGTINKFAIDKREIINKLLLRGILTIFIVKNVAKHKHKKRFIILKSKIKFFTLKIFNTVNKSPLEYE
jgi:hypothetical protein